MDKKDLYLESLTKKDILDMFKVGCEVPGCNCKGCNGEGLVLKAKCHPKYPPNAIIQESGILEIRCSTCDDLVCKFLIGD